MIHTPFVIVITLLRERNGGRVKIVAIIVSHSWKKETVQRRREGDEQLTRFSVLTPRDTLA